MLRGVGAARPTDHVRRQDDGMEEPGSAGLTAPDAGCRGHRSRERIWPESIPLEVRRALAALLDGTVGKNKVSQTRRKVKSDWDTWNTRLLAGEPVVRLILDGTVVRVRLDLKATSISLLLVLDVRAETRRIVAPRESDINPRCTSMRATPLLPIVTLAAGVFQLAPRIVSFAVAICLIIVGPVG